MLLPPFAMDKARLSSEGGVGGVSAAGTKRGADGGRGVSLPSDEGFLGAAGTKRGDDGGLTVGVPNDPVNRLRKDDSGSMEPGVPKGLAGTNRGGVGGVGTNCDGGAADADSTGSRGLSSRAIGATWVPLARGSQAS